MLGPEADLVLGQDHPVGDGAANLAPVEPEAVRQHRPRQRDADGRADAEVPRAADDLARLALPDVDLRHLEPVGVRVLPGLEHGADPEEVEIPAGVVTPGRSIPSTSAVATESRVASSSSGISIG